MRRAINLFQKVTSFDALLKATERAKKACAPSPPLDALLFYVERERECLKLREVLINQSYEPGIYRTFMLFEPKPRLISAAPFVDRVVHHSLCAALAPTLENYAIFDSYACRKGKGLHKAVARCQHFSRRFTVYLKLDIHHYFESIDHQVLKNQLKHRFKEQRVLGLCEQIIDRGAPGSLAGKGLPIGNLTSQHFANYYLSFLDRFIKQDLRCKGYLRYMDDLVLFADDFATLRQFRHEIDDLLTHTLHLKLKERAERLDWVSSGVPFLGLRIYPDRIYFDQGRKRRLLARLRHLNLLDPQDIDDTVLAQAASLYAWADLADSTGLLSSWHRSFRLHDLED